MIAHQVNPTQDSPTEVQFLHHLQLGLGLTALNGPRTPVLLENSSKYSWRKVWEWKLRNESPTYMAMFTRLNVNNKKYKTLTLTLKFKFNAWGNPYVEGDPNLGYILEDIRPQNAPSHLTSNLATSSSPSKLGSKPKPISPSHKPPINMPHSQPLSSPTQQHQFMPKTHSHLPQTHQSDPKHSIGQNKPKPINWVSLL